MFSDNILQFNYSLTNNRPVQRQNPFLQERREVKSDILDISLTINEDSINEDHFSNPMPNLGDHSSVGELERATREVKQRILQLMSPYETGQREQLVRRLVELNRSLYLARERGKSEPTKPLEDVKADMMTALAGHSLVRGRQSLVQQRLCEACGANIRPGRALYSCTECIVHVHAAANCTQRLSRQCPAAPRRRLSLMRHTSTDGGNSCDQTAAAVVVVSGPLDAPQSPSLELDISSFPLAGSLCRQRFLCGDCSRPISLEPTASRGGRAQARFCSYYRLFCCPRCHWGNSHLVPSVFFMLALYKKLPVCRSAYVKLKFCWSRALFRAPSFWLENWQPASDLLKLRQRLVRMRHFRPCPGMSEVTNQYPDWVVDQPFLITLEFAFGTSPARKNETGRSVQLLYSAMLGHVRDCASCLSRCRQCQVCEQGESLVPGDLRVWACGKCGFECIHASCIGDAVGSEFEFLCRDCLCHRPISLAIV